MTDASQNQNNLILKKKTFAVAVVGSGPAGLMAASELSSQNIEVTVFEKRPGAGRKLLVAGSSGLNITYDAPIKLFVKYYLGGISEAEWVSILTEFSPQQWVRFIEELGCNTFLGTSRRYFIKEMKAAAFLQSWIAKLKNQGVKFKYKSAVNGLEFLSDKSLSNAIHANCNNITLTWSEGETSNTCPFDAVCFALGGASWEDTDEQPKWLEIFKDKEIKFSPFQASNVGFEIDWKPAFLKEASRSPLKRIAWSSPKGKKMGDVMITEYGVEGTPIYFVGQTGINFVDLLPEITELEIFKRLTDVKENLSPIRRVKKKLNLSPTAFALLFHHSPALKDLQSWAGLIKKFPIQLKEKRPLTEAISSAGGVSYTECNRDLMIERMPGVFIAGEMLDWDAPTGGFLIQGCVSQGFRAAKGILKFLKKSGS